MRYVYAFWPAAVWMCIIFFGSTGVGTTERTSRIIGPILRWFYPEISDEVISGIQLFIRKCAHIIEYAILAGLVWAGRRKLEGNFRKFDWGEAWRVIMPVVCLYAITDEFHQSFVPGREGALRDFAFDTAGGILGLVAIWAVGRWRKIW